MKFNSINTLTIIIMSASELNKPFPWAGACTTHDNGMQQKQLQLQQQQSVAEDSQILSLPPQLTEQHLEEDEDEDGQIQDEEKEEEEEELDEREDVKDEYDFDEEESLEKCDEAQERRAESEEEGKQKQMKGRRPKVVRHVKEKRKESKVQHKEEKEQKRCKKKSEQTVNEPTKKIRKDVSRRVYPSKREERGRAEEQQEEEDDDDNEEEEKEEEARSDSPGLDLSVFQPRGKRKCVIRNERQNKHRTEWWSLGVDGEGVKEDDEDDEDDADGDDDAHEDDEDYQHDTKSKVTEAKKRRKGKQQQQPQNTEEAKSEPSEESVTKCCYVFSTGMANRAGYAVEKGHFDTITAYHEAQMWDTPYLSAELHCGRSIPDDDDDETEVAREGIDPDKDDNGLDHCDEEKGKPKLESFIKGEEEEEEEEEIKGIAPPSPSTGQGHLTVAQAEQLLAQFHKGTKMNRMEEEDGDDDEVKCENYSTGQEEEDLNMKTDPTAEECVDTTTATTATTTVTTTASTVTTTASSVVSTPAITTSIKTTADEEEESEWKTNPQHPRYALFSKSQCQEMFSPPSDIQEQPTEYHAGQSIKSVNNDSKDVVWMGEEKHLEGNKQFLPAQDETKVEHLGVLDLRNSSNDDNAPCSSGDKSNINKSMVTGDYEDIKRSALFGSNRDMDANERVLAWRRDLERADLLNKKPSAADDRSNPTPPPPLVPSMSTSTGHTCRDRGQSPVLQPHHTSQSQPQQPHSLQQPQQQPPPQQQQPTQQQHSSQPQPQQHLSKPQPHQQHSSQSYLQTSSPSFLQTSKASNISYPADITKENLRYQSPKAFSNDRLEESSSEVKAFTASRPSVLSMPIGGNSRPVETVRSSIDVAEKALKEARSLPSQRSGSAGPILPRDIHHSAFMSRHSSYLQPPLTAPLASGISTTTSIFSSRLHGIPPFSPHSSHTSQSPFRSLRGSSERIGSHTAPISPHIPPHPHQHHYRHGGVKSPPDTYLVDPKCNTFTSSSNPRHPMFNERPASTNDIGRHLSLSDRHSVLADRHAVADRLPLNDRHSALNERHLSLSERMERDRSLALASRHPGASAINERLLPLVDKQTRAHALSDRATPGLNDRLGGASERISGGPSSPSHHHFGRAAAAAEKMTGVYPSDPFSVKSLTGIGDKTFKKPDDDHSLDRLPDPHSLDRPSDRHYDPISRSMDNPTLNERHMSSLTDRLHGANGLQLHNGLKRSLDEQLSTHITGHRDKKYIDQIHDVDRERFLLHEKERFAHVHHPRLPYPSPGGHRSPLRVGSQPFLPRTLPNGSTRPELVPSPPTHSHSSTYHSQMHQHVHPFSTAHR